jgi:hypothetical protein
MVSNTPLILQCITTRYCSIVGSTVLWVYWRGSVPPRISSAWRLSSHNINHHTRHAMNYRPSQRPAHIHFCSIFPRFTTQLHHFLTKQWKLRQWVLDGAHYHLVFYPSAMTMTFIGTKHPNLATDKQVLAIAVLVICNSIEMQEYS